MCLSDRFENESRRICEALSIDGAQRVEEFLYFERGAKLGQDLSHRRSCDPLEVARKSVDP